MHYGATILCSEIETCEHCQWNTHVLVDMKLPFKIDNIVSRGHTLILPRLAEWGVAT